MNLCNISEISIHPHLITDYFTCVRVVLLKTHSSQYNSKIIFFLSHRHLTFLLLERSMLV